MSILDSISGAAGDGKVGLLDGIMGMIGTQGGLGGIADKFASGGLGDIVNSWIGTGTNKPVSTDQLTSVIGKEQITDIANKTGLPIGEVTSQLANNLPNIIDRLTPEGKIPEGNILEKGLEALKGIF